jgi:hypothetical protein
MPTIATKTLAAIEAAMLKDQGAKFRGLLEKLLPTAGDAYSTDETPFRKHLGASLIGRKCARELWLSFHWTRNKKHSGKMLRLFNRGHLEEPRMVALLIMIGCQVWQADANGKQWRIVDDTGHFGGSLDGVAKGIPEMPNEPVLTEFKTHNDSSFKKLQSEGVQVAKWEHFIQMQVYMMRMKLRHSLYMAVNKNNDEVYAELIAYNPETAERYWSRGVTIVQSPQPPAKISDNPSHYDCKWCDMHPVCQGKDAPARNCRTCSFSQAVPQKVDGVGALWFCHRDRTYIPIEKQYKGCDAYDVNPLIKKPL